MTTSTCIEGLGNLRLNALSMGQGPALKSILAQLERSQWSSPKELRDAQYEQLSRLCDHAAKTIPFHAQRLKGAGFVTGRAMTPEIWSRVPILNRSDVRDLEEKLQASSYSEELGRTWTASSGGSTGIPVRVVKTELDVLIWQAVHLREILWNRVLDGEEMANMRGISKDAYLKSKEDPLALKEEGGLVMPDWGAPVKFLRRTGSMGILQPDQSLAVQSDFLLKRQPQHLLMRPAGLRLLLSYFREKGLRLMSLRGVWTVSECVDDSLREECWALFGCPIISNYSANEVGYMALQCPGGTNYHVMSESVYLEVVGANGETCRPGEIGRVLVTPLHNYAMPLLRYQVGDEAEVGEPCACGRGLPTLKQIVGRTQDYLTLKSGEKIRVNLSHYRICLIGAVREFQLIQKNLETIELRVVTSRPLDGEELGKLRELIEKPYGKHFTCLVSIVERLPRSQSGKLLQFVSEVLPTQV